LKVLPKLLDCWRVVLNISYRRISASETDRRANLIASSKCSLSSQRCLLNHSIWVVDLHSDGRNIILLVLLIHKVNVDVLASSLGLVLLLSVLSHVALDTGSDSKLGSSLTDLGEIGTGESSSVLGEEVEIDTRSEGRLSQSC
jgi:hypothetical protein